MLRYDKKMQPSLSWGLAAPSGRCGRVPGPGHEHATAKTAISIPGMPRGRVQGRTLMSVNPSRSTPRRAKPSGEVAVPRVPPGVIGLLLLLTAVLAIIFIVAAQN